MAEKMNAYVMTGPEQGEVMQIDRFAPGLGEAVVKTAAVAVCTTERRIYAGALKIPFPVIGGHEVSGTVVEVNGGDLNVKQGDKVVLDAINRCGDCYYCTRGHSYLCERAYSSGRQGYRIVGGGFAEYVTLSAKRLFKFSGQIGYEEAALAEPLSCCVHSIKRSGITFGDNVAIVGAGTMGSLHILLARRFGASVLAVDLDDERLELARKLGATWTLNARASNGVEFLQQQTEGRGADAVFITASTKTAGESAIQLVGKLGRVIFFAATYPPEKIEIPWNLLHHQEVSLVGSVGKTEEDFREAVALLSNRSVDVRPLISRMISLSELNRELGEYPSGDVQRVVVQQQDL